MRALAAVLALAAAFVVADVVLGVFSVPAAAIEHGLVQVVLWPFVLLDEYTRLLPHRPRDVVLRGLLLGGAFWGLALLAVRWRAARVAQEIVLGLPLLLVALGVLGAGLALAPPVVVGGGAAGVFGYVAVGPAREHETALTGGARALLSLGAGLALAAMSTVLASGPGDTQAPFAALAALEGLLPPTAWSWLVAPVGIAGLLLLAPASTRSGLALRRLAPALVLGVLVTASLTGWFAPRGDGARQALAAAPLPLVTGTLGGLLAASGWGLQLPRGPLGLLAGATLPLVAALLGLVHSATTGFLGCAAVRAHPAVTVVSPRPGTFALQPVPEAAGGPAVVVAFRDQERLSWIPLSPGGAPRELVLDTLPLEGWGGAPQPVRHAYPEELGLDPDGRVHVWVEVPPPGDERLHLLLDGATGETLELQELPGACFVSSWLWDDGRGRALAGCEWQGDLMVDEGGRIGRRSVEGGGELEELVASSDGDTLWAVSLWSHPYLVRIDPLALRVTDRAFIGSFNWGLGYDPERDLLAVPRFIAGQVLFVDAETLEPRASVRAGWGLRPLVQRGDAWLTASTYDGWLYAVDPFGRRDALRLGGWVRDLDLLDADTLLAGGACGVLSVDLPAWLGESGGDG